LIKALIRFSMVLALIVIDGLITIFFEKNEIVSYQLLVKKIEKTPDEKQKILVDYLEKCHKQVLKEERNAKKDTKEETDGKTKKIL